VFQFLKSFSQRLADLRPPWASSISIYDFVRTNPNSTELPDDRKKPGRDEIRWMEGALDGVIGHHMSVPKAGDVSDRVQQLSNALSQLLKEPSDRNLKLLYETVVADAILPIADSLQERLSNKIVPSYRVQAAEVGRYFAFHGDQREATKFGILLLELTAMQSDVPLLETLALREEFTLFAAIALARTVANPSKALWNIAKQVRGWGRIQIVERLNGTRDPEIQAWMLRDGFRNEVMNNYLAGICARTGNLHLALEVSQIDRPLLDGTAGLIRALIEGGPADSIDEYQHALPVIRLYIDHVLRADSLVLEHLICVSDILQFLSTEDGWESRFSKGWTGELRDLLRKQCQGILNRDEWRRQIDSELQSEDAIKFFEADLAAARLGISTRDLHFARVRSSPATSDSWYRLLEQTDETGIDEIVDFAIQYLPLKEIATGPKNVTIGLGPGYELHNVLDLLLQAVKRFPGKGWELIETGVCSPLVRNRNMAVSAFLEWRRDQWPDRATEFFRQALADEPDDELRGRLEQMVGPA
jgi:hypothetical protein